MARYTMARRIKQIKLTPDQMIGLTKQRIEIVNLPEKYRIEYSETRIREGVHVLVVYSPEFPEVKPGERIPELVPEFRGCMPL